MVWCEVMGDLMYEEFDFLPFLVMYSTLSLETPDP